MSTHTLSSRQGDRDRLSDRRPQVNLGGRAVLRANGGLSGYSRTPSQQRGIWAGHALRYGSRRERAGALIPDSGIAAWPELRSGQPRPDLLGVCVLQVVEYRQGFFPGLARGCGVSGGVARVTQMGEDLAPKVYVRVVVEDFDRLLEAHDGLIVVAEVMVGVAEAV
jgi:hypothetical protein